MRWMNLEPVLQSELSQKEKNKHILTPIYGIQKNGIDEPICREGTETPIRDGLVETVRGGETGMNGESIGAWTLPG